MNNLIEMSGEMTMGTREIAKLLNRDHSDIRRSANRLVDSGVINGVSHWLTPHTPMIRTAKHTTNTDSTNSTQSPLLHRTVRNSRQHWLSAGMSLSEELQSQASWIA